MARRRQLPDAWEQMVRRGVAYWQVLDEEHQRRNIFQRLEHFLSLEFMREKSRLGPRPKTQ